MDQRQALEDAMVENFGVEAEKITAESISGAVSAEMKQDALWAVIVATILMLLYIWFRFKNIKFAASAILALVHDVLVVLTFYAVAKWSVGSTFIACMLTIVGYSINATIVIFDRIRENLAAGRNKETLEELVNKSITQTVTRSINTSLTTFIMVFVLYLMGVSAIREFALPLMVGIVCGTYSSVCVTGAPVSYTHLLYLVRRHTRISVFHVIGYACDIKTLRGDLHGLEENWADETTRRRRRSSQASFFLKISEFLRKI